MSSRIHRRVRTTAFAPWWALAAAMSGVGLVRLSRSERRAGLIGLQGIGMWLLLPAYPLALAAALARRRALAAVAVGLAVGNAVWAREMSASAGPDTPAEDSVAVHLVTSNMLLNNHHVAAMAADLLATGADVIALQELTPENLAGLRASGLLAAYPHQVLDPRPGSYGSAILSKHPIAAGGAIELAGKPMTRADVLAGPTRFRLLNVHTVAPTVTRGVRTWRAQLQMLAAMPDEFDGPVVVAGDFNATADHASMAELLGSGLRDAFTVAGRGVGATWPQWSGATPGQWPGQGLGQWRGLGLGLWPGPMIPLMRLDHVLVDDTVGVLSARVQHNPGSDHRRLSVELAVPKSTEK